MKYLSILAVILLLSCNQSEKKYTGWKIKGGTADGIQYSQLDRINRENVNQLQVAWSFRSGDADTINNRTQIQCNPIVVGNVLYGTTPALKAFALEANSGKLLWKFEPSEANTGLGVNRGVTYWEEGDDKRILYTFGENLYALNALDGKKIESFGTEGRVSLKEGLGDRAVNLMVLSNTPGVIFKDLIIMGSRVHEGPIAAPGYIRAFNVKTGKLIWTFHTIPQPGEFGYDTWPADAWKKIGGANSWAGMSVDPERGLVFASTGSASFDFYGGNRPGQNLFANCVLALDAETGIRKWHYQTIHHDMWDRDLPAAPLLVTVTHNGERIDAVSQTTKSGYVFLLNRDSGEPLFPVEEVTVPASDLEGEQAWATQPVPTKPPPFSRQVFTEDMINTVTPEGEAFVKEKFIGLKTGQQFIPPSKEGTIIFPGFDGGAEWGGPSFDPESGILFVNANEMPWILTMVDVRMKEDAWIGISLYRTHCATCHGTNRGGDGHVFPSLRNLQEKYSKESLMKFMLSGKGVMPAFSHLSEKERDAISRYVLDLEERTDEERKGNFRTRSGNLIFKYWL
jgi:quinoprotein glucose dehydrogenase